MPTLPSTNQVTAIAAATPAEAEAHFAGLLRFETDCWDVHAALGEQHDRFVVLDVRGPTAYAGGHVPGAINLPHSRISPRALESFPAEMLFVVYCNGPHCNGADRAALALARLGRPVKKMIGGITGWLSEGFALERTSHGHESA